MKKKFFGTDGIRGVANVYPMTGEIIHGISRSAAKIMKERSKGKRFVFIGKDTRLSCDMLETAIASGLMSQGIHVYRLGVIPTPALAFLTRKRNALFGVMISASHNPFYDNGIKFIGPDGFKLDDTLEIEIEKDFLQTDCRSNDIDDAITHRDIGRMYEKYSYRDDYIEHCIAPVEKFDFSDLKVLIDCANGATSHIATEVFETLGMQYQIIDNNPTGDNINNECGSTNMQKIMKIVAEEDFDCGIAFDGDGDRCLMVDEKGNLMDGDIMMAICYQHRVKTDPSFNKKLIATVMSNMGLKEVVSKNNGSFLETTVGDKYVLKSMIENDGLIGGEQSGHIIFLERNTTGDGIIAAIEMLKIRAEKKLPFSRLIEETGFRRYPQVLYNIKVRTKDGLWDIKALKDAVKSFDDEFKDRGRILIRPSGTEPLVRVMAEALELDKAENKLKEIMNIIESELGENR